MDGEVAWRHVIGQLATQRIHFGHNLLNHLHNFYPETVPISRLTIPPHSAKLTLVLLLHLVREKMRKNSIPKQTAFGWGEWVSACVCDKNLRRFSVAYFVATTHGTHTHTRKHAYVNVFWKIIVFTLLKAINGRGWRGWGVCVIISRSSWD